MMEKELPVCNCTACGACVYICSKNAVELKNDKVGELLPYIDVSKCINCGKCTDICEKINSEKESYPINYFIAVHKDNDIIHKSASGGMTTALCQYIFDRGGAVYGAHFDSSSLSVKHIRIGKREDIALIRKSKYAQSCISTEIYGQIDCDLETGRPVLFIGTPCQAAAVRRVFGNPDNLFIADLICHGVVREKIFKDYLNYIESKDGKIVNIDFRGECEDSVNFNFTVETDKSCYSEFCNDNLLYKLFINSAALKHSCFECNFVCSHMSDIILADFPTEKAKKSGLICSHPSIVMINNFMGRQMFLDAADMLEFTEFTDREYIMKNYFFSHRDRKEGWGYYPEMYKKFNDIYIHTFYTAAFSLCYETEYSIVQKIMDMRSNNEALILYGAGAVGKNIARYIKEKNNDRKIFFAVTEKTDDEIDGIKVFSLEELRQINDKDNYLICVSVTEKYRDEIEKNARDAGFRKVVI